MFQGGRYKRNRLLLCLLQHILDNVDLLNRKIGVGWTELLVLKI